jgi:hypothetical protein
MRTLKVMILGAGMFFAATGAVAAPAKVPVGKMKMPLLSYTIDKSGPASGAHPKRSDLITVNYSLTARRDRGRQLDQARQARCLSAQPADPGVANPGAADAGG